MTSHYLRQLILKHKVALIECAPEGLRASDIAPTRWHAYNIKALIKLEEMQDQFDIIHNHMGYAALPALNEMRCPSVSTNHNPVYDYCRGHFSCLQKNAVYFHKRRVQTAELSK